MIATEKKCCYCDHAIDDSTLDWGMTLVDYSYRYWHQECFFIVENLTFEDLDEAGEV